MDTFATVTMPFGARTDQKFALSWRLAEEWETTHGSLFHAFDLMQARREATASQVRDLIRLGLQGAGMGPTDVLVAIARHVEARPLAESFPIAMAIAGGFLFGMEPVAAGSSVAPRPDNGETKSEAPPSVLPDAGASHGSRPSFGPPSRGEIGSVDVGEERRQASEGGDGQ